ncbi:MAG: DEK C-terminal domain-containing protein, partial [Candidatus Cyclobacteriaceae bacterium M3_2C_046]
LWKTYFSTALPGQQQQYQSVLKEFIPKRVPEGNLLDFNTRTLFKFYGQYLKQQDLNTQQKKGLKNQLNRHYQNHLKEYKAFKKFLKGRKRFPLKPNIYNQPWSISFPVTNPSMDFQVHFMQKKNTLSTLSFDTLSGNAADFLPELEMATCIPFNRTTYFKTLQGISLQKYHYEPYTVPKQIRGYRKFEIFFERNQTTCTYKDVAGIIKLLSDSAYTISKARIKAFASVEGTTEINMKLHAQRARLMIDLLQRYNQDSIELVGLITEENWSRFYQQLAGTPFENWQGLSKAQIKQKLTQPQILTQWEDALNDQRKAELELLLWQNASDSAQLDRALQDYHKLVTQYQEFYQNDQEYEPTGLELAGKILSVREFISHKNPAYPALELNSSHPASAITDLYYLMIHESNHDDPRRLFSHSRDSIILKAYQVILEKTKQATHLKKLDYYIRLGSDLQTYVFENLDNPEIICQLQWPDEPAYYPLILHKMKYLAEKPGEFFRQLSCYTSDGESEVPDEPVNMAELHAISFSAPLGYQLPHSDYYFLLKKQVIFNDQHIGSWAIRSDDYLEFDLYEFLFINILNWDVWNNQYYDPELDYQEMIKQMDRLLKIHDILCPNQMYQLYLDLHLRVSYLLKHHPELSGKVFSSLKKLSQYYADHLDQLDQASGMKLVKHLLWMGQYYHKNETYYLATDLLEKMSQQKLATNKNRQKF